MRRKQVCTVWVRRTVKGQFVQKCEASPVFAAGVTFMLSVEKLTSAPLMVYSPAALLHSLMLIFVELNIQNSPRLSPGSIFLMRRSDQGESVELC